MNLYVTSDWHKQFHTSTVQIRHNDSVADKASNFSVSTRNRSSGRELLGGSGGGSVGAF